MGRQSRRKWKCLGCGMRMHRELAGPAGAIVEKIRGRRGKVILHVCGVCKCLHLAGPDGMLRRLTAVERFRVEAEHGEDLRQIRAAEFAQEPEPTVTLWLPKE